MNTTHTNTTKSNPATSITEELEKVSQDIDAMLRDDPFPASVQPAYLQEAVTAYPNRGGKRMRPAIVFWSCGLLGGNPSKARHAALAVELFHNWTLIHDDIIDQDGLRRGGATCHVLVSERAKSLFNHMDEEQTDLFGVHMAILAGDILQSWAASVLNRLSHEGIPRWKINTLLERMNGRLTPHLISGEAMDVELGQRDHVDRRKVEHAMELKTGALLAYAAEAGGILSDSVDDVEAPELKTLNQFGHTLGLAFQLQDDYLGLYGSGQKLGKDIGSDLREGRITYPVACTLEKASPEDREALWAILRQNQLSDDDVQHAYALIDRYGGDGVTLQRTEELFGEAEQLLAQFSTGEYRDLLEQLVSFLRQRQA